MPLSNLRQYGTSVGPVLLGVVFNTFLYGLACYQYAQYYSSGSGSKDPLWIRATVVALFITDTIHSAILIYLAWCYCVANYDNPQILAFVLWPYGLTTISNAFEAILMHGFLSCRIWRLTRNVYIYVALMVLAVATLCLGLISGIGFLRMTSGIKTLLKSEFGAWMISQTITDVCITSILGLVFYRYRTGFSTSNSVINRLIRGSIQTGLFPSVLAIGCLVFFFLPDNTNIEVMFALPIGRVYANTLMDTLLAREGLKEQLTGTQFLRTFTVPPSTSIQSHRRSRSNTTALPSVGTERSNVQGQTSNRQDDNLNTSK